MNVSNGVDVEVGGLNEAVPLREVHVAEVVRRPEAALNAASGGDMPKRDRQRVRILVDGERRANIAEFIQNKVEPHLLNAGIYRYGGVLARVKIVSRGEKLKGLKNVDVLGPVVETVDLASLSADITRVIEFTRIVQVQRRPEEVPDAPQPFVIKSILAAPDWPTTPILEGITSSPFIRPDGTVCDKGGYDPETGWYLEYCGSPLNVPDVPTESQVREAVEVLLRLTDQFEWEVAESDCDLRVKPGQAGFIAYLLTLVARPAIDGPVPAFVFNATAMGAGKTLLSKTANIIASGAEPSMTDAAQGDRTGEELRKMLFSFGASGSQSILLDNWPSGTKVGGSGLDMAITSRYMEGRILGVSKTARFPWRAVVSVGGNALSVTSDFSDRCVWISLQPTVEKAREREPEGGFEFWPLDRHVAENREKYLSCALTILRSHFVNNKPKPSGAKGWGTFDSWVSAIRDCVMNLTGIDLRNSLSSGDVEDAESSELASLITGLHEVQQLMNREDPYGRTQRWTVTDLHSFVNKAQREQFGSNTVVFPSLQSVVDFDVTAKAFTRTCPVRRYVGRVWNGLKITKRKLTKDQFTYAVEVAKSGKTAPNPLDKIDLQ